MATILLIDDDLQLRKVIRRMLEGAGHVVLEAYDGRAGLKLFEDCGPELVITDVIMPGMEGIETLRAMRKLEPTARVIAMSGSRATSQDVLRFMKSFGAAETLEKPFRREQLLDAVTRVLAQPL